MEKMRGKDVRIKVKKVNKEGGNVENFSGKVGGKKCEKV